MVQGIGLQPLCVLLQNRRAPALVTGDDRCPAALRQCEDSNLRGSVNSGRSTCICGSTRAQRLKTGEGSYTPQLLNTHPKRTMGPGNVNLSSPPTLAYCHTCRKRSSSAGVRASSSLSSAGVCTPRPSDAAPRAISACSTCTVKRHTVGACCLATPCAVKESHDPGLATCG